MRATRRMLEIEKVLAEPASEGVTQRQFACYVRNCAGSPSAGRLERVLLAQIERLLDDQGGAAAAPDLEDMSLRRKRQLLSRVLERNARLPPAGDVLEKNARFARAEFGLDATDAEILLLLLRYEAGDSLEPFADGVLQRLGSPAAAVAALLGIGRVEAERRIAASGALVASGLVCLSTADKWYWLAGKSGYLCVAPPLRRVMRRACGSRREWTAALLGRPLATPLAWEDFAHLGPARDLAARMLAGAVAAGASGVNLLLHGPVGTGKTEFAKALAAQTGLEIWSAGETDEDGKEPTRTERLAAWQLLLRLLGRRKRALLLFDEAEDVLSQEMSAFGMFGGRSGNTGRSKVYLNRLLEHNAVPTIWTCNETAAMDPAVLRRMILAVAVGTPGRPARGRIWRRVLDEAGLGLEAGSVDRLSQRYAAPAAVAANAARAAVLSGGGEAAVGEALGGVLPLLGIADVLPDADAGAFDPTLVNCETDLQRLAERLVRPGGPRNWSLCLSGPPGTGKSLFARALAGGLGMEVMQRRASDLLSCYVGESEQQIAAAFREARARGAMLVIDEADSLLSDRRGAEHSWEVSQVNEMLTWMESHPLPFVCTTNLAGRLDLASLRRFTLKLSFEPLDTGRARLAFERFFGVAPPRRLAEGLTPGDFATVRRKRDLLGLDQLSVLADWLDAEAAAKGGRPHPVGFALPAVVR